MEQYGQGLAVDGRTVTCDEGCGDQPVSSITSRQRRGRSLLCLLALSLASSCASLGPDTTAAGDAAVAFHQAVSDQNGSAACALLAPGTLTELEQTVGSSCDQAVLDQDLPGAWTVQDSQAFGRGAQVVLDGDVVFLSIFDGQWRITAAGCEPDGDRPYNCAVKGN
jgi:hypothetical protein